MTREKRASTSKKTYAEDLESDPEDDEPVASTSMARVKRRVKEQDDDDFGEDDAEPEPATKKAKRAPAKGKGRGRVGKLAVFNAMPLDVLGEICSHLDPLSLLYMSRTTKSIRQLLTSKGSRALWISARRTVALPDLAAEDVTEMLYASLVFERNCMVCGKGRASKCDYAIRARYCQPCQKANVYTENRVAGAVPGLHPLALSCSPFTFVSTTGRVGVSLRHHFFAPDVKKTSKILTALELEHRELRNLSDDDSGDDAPSTSKKGKSKAKAKIKGKGKSLARLAPAAAADDDDESAKGVDADETPFEHFVRKRQAAVAHCRDDAKLIFKWEHTSVQDRQAASNAAAKNRTAAIDAKMVALGYDLRDVHRIFSTTYLHGKELTDRIWNKISHQIIASTISYRDYRLQSEAETRRRQRRQLISPLYHALFASLTSPDLNFPTESEFPDLPTVKAFWDPEGIQIVSSAWAAALPAVHSDIAAHQVMTKQKYFIDLAITLHLAESPIDTALVSVREIIPAPTYGPTIEAVPSTDLTDAAMDAVFAQYSARFLCCKLLLPYADICKHRRTQHYSTGPNRRFYGIAEEASLLELLISTLAREGLDESATDADINQLGPVFECHKCPAKKLQLDAQTRAAQYRHRFAAIPSGVPAFVPMKTTDLLWSEALEHFVKHHSSPSYGCSGRMALIKKMADEVDPEVEAKWQAKEALALKEELAAFFSDSHGY